MIREQHIRFLREAHAGAALHMTGGVLEIGPDEARLLLEVLTPIIKSWPRLSSGTSTCS